MDSSNPLLRTGLRVRKGSPPLIHKIPGTVSRDFLLQVFFMHLRSLFFRKFASQGAPPVSTTPAASMPPHCRKRLSFFPSPAGMSLTKLSLAGNNLIIPGLREIG